MPTPARLAAFIAEVHVALASTEPQPAIAAALARLVAQDDWLPPAYAQPHAEHYQQYLLHADPQGRFSIVSFVWGPGQQTPIHDHGVWGAVGVLRGAEQAQAFSADGTGPPRALGAPHRLTAGMVERIGPGVGDIHQVSNAHPGVSVSIHIYGTDIGRHRRHVYPIEGGIKPFISGYAGGPDTPAFSA
ncbi:cysteine dioxygenase [Sphingomonas sp. IBVSS1]|nr:cysteine dioxygenase [Sphingomonas sp. IBVSS1]